MAALNILQHIVDPLQIGGRANRHLPTSAGTFCSPVKALKDGAPRISECLNKQGGVDKRLTAQQSVRKQSVVTETCQSSGQGAG